MPVWRRRAALFLAAAFVATVAATTVAVVHPLPSDDTFLGDADLPDPSFIDDFPSPVFQPFPLLDRVVHDRLELQEPLPVFLETKPHKPFVVRFVSARGPPLAPSVLSRC